MALAELGWVNRGMICKVAHHVQRLMKVLTKIRAVETYASSSKQVPQDSYYCTHCRLEGWTEHGMVDKINLLFG